MLERFRSGAAMIIAPFAAWLNRLGVSPDLVTALGTLGVTLAAVICFPQGWLVPGALLVTFFCLADMLDGQMAKMSGTASAWGAFLDSTLDRLGDAAVFGGILLYFAGHRAEPVWAAVTLVALIFGQLTSYVRARAESLGYAADGGLAARADRLLIILLGALLAGFGVPWVLQIAITFLALAGLVTVVQRIAHVYRQAKRPVGDQLQGRGADS
jgi:CDP-diacylglycerol--glycerol-3-phosphate 3-phosphatidyltransferase